MSFDYYAMLGLAPDAPLEVVRAAYRALVQKYHPDRYGQSAEAQARTARLNEAYRVLSDPDRRRAYDATRTRDATRARPAVADRPGTSSVSGQAAGHAFTLRFIPGYVFANDLWTYPRIHSHGGRVISQVMPQQRLCVRTAERDVFVPHSGQPLPFATGQDVELVHAFHDTRRGCFIALVNRSSGQWFWLYSQADAGKYFRRRGAHVIDVLAYHGLVALLAFALWALCVRGNGFFPGAAFLFLGLPLLFVAATPVLFRTADTIGWALHDAMGRAVNRSLT